MSNLYDASIGSPVHQILLAHGEVDRLPDSRIQLIKSKTFGEYKLWMEDDIVELIKTRYSDDVLKAYMSLKPLAYKADLARYCIIHTYGGWYFDLFVEIQDLKVLEHFTDNVEALIFREMLVPPGGSLLSVLNTVFWFKDPGHKVLGDLIQSVTENVLNAEYGSHPFSVTGALEFGRQVARYELESSRAVFMVGDCSMVDGYPTHQINSSMFDNPLVVSRRRRILDDISSEVPSGYERHPNSYYQMWLDRDIFN